MMIISIGGTRHISKRLGQTLCGVSYPKTWPTALARIDCEDCLRLIRAEAKAKLEAAKPPQAPGGEDMPWW